MKELLQQIIGVEHGFKHIVKAGQIMLKDGEPNVLELAQSFIEPHQAYQIRMLGTYLLGVIAAKNPEALQILENTVALDDNWRVQEMLAKAFDDYCKAIGYENALPRIKHWITHENIHVKRAITEGLRIWTSRDYFREHPEMAVGLISNNKYTDSEYLRKSIGNSLRDIYKKHKEPVDLEVANWDLTHKELAFIHKLIYK